MRRGLIILSRKCCPPAMEKRVFCVQIRRAQSRSEINCPSSFPILQKRKKIRRRWLRYGTRFCRHEALKLVKLAVTSLRKGKSQQRTFLIDSRGKMLMPDWLLFSTLISSLFFLVNWFGFKFVSRPAKYLLLLLLLLSQPSDSVKNYVRCDFD